MKTLVRLLPLASLMFATFCVSAAAEPPVWDAASNGDFELAAALVAENDLPTGWHVRSGPWADQITRLVPRDDAAGYCLRFTKVGEKRSSYHRVVQKLANVTLHAGQSYVLEADMRVLSAPQGKADVQLGVSTTGGSTRASTGHQDYVEGAHVEPDANVVGRWQRLRVEFTPAEDVHEPWLLLSETHWAPYPYTVEVDDIRLWMPAAEVAAKEAKVHVVLPAEPMLVERQAAELLAETLPKITGCKAKIVSEARAGETQTGEAVQFYVGRTTRAAEVLAGASADSNAAEALEGVLDELTSDGYFMDVRPGQVILVGRDDLVPWAEKEYPGVEGMSQSLFYNAERGIAANGQRGTYFAASELLRRYADVEWYWPGETGEVLPARDRLLVPVGRQSHAPDFSLRLVWGVRFSESPQGARWYIRAGFGSSIDPCWPNHSSHRIARIENAVEEHPEWFAIHNGRLNPHSLAWGNPELADVYTRLALEHFEQYPDSKMYRVMPADGVRPSEDPHTQAKLDWSPPTLGDGALGGNGLMSNAVFEIADEVARRVAEKYPDRQIGCCAYATYLKPPWTKRTVSENLTVMFCAMTPFMWPAGEYADGIRRFEQMWFGKDVKDYTCWEYLLPTFVRGSNGIYAPFIVPRLIHERYARLAGRCRGAFAQLVRMSSEMSAVGTMHLNWHVLARTWWDNDLDVDLLIARYARNAFGPAADAMNRFWRIQEEAWMGRRDTVQWNPLLMGRWNHVFTPEVLEEMFAALEEARRIARDAGREDILRRIDLIADEYAMLHRCRQAALEEIGSEPLAPGGSFETRAGDADRWTLGEGAGIVADDRAVEGENVLKLADHVAVARSREYPFEAGRWYFVSAWMRTEGNGDRDEPDSCPRILAGRTSQAIRPGNRPYWQRVFVVFRAKGPGRIELRGGDGFTTWADGVVVEDLGESDQQPSAPIGGWNQPAQR